MPKSLLEQYTDHLALELRSTEIDETGTFEGFASVFGEVDLVGDTVAPGAFAKSLAAHRRKGRMPLLSVDARPRPPRSAAGSTSGKRPKGYGSRASCSCHGPGPRSLRHAAREGDRRLDRSAFGRSKSARTKTGRLLQEICSSSEISLGRTARPGFGPGHLRQIPAPA